MNSTILDPRTNIFINTLREVCLEVPDDEFAVNTLWFEPTAVELADAVWLATQIGLSTDRQKKSTPINEAVSQQEDISTLLPSDDIESSVEEPVILQPEEINTSVAQEDLPALPLAVDTESQPIVVESQVQQEESLRPENYQDKKSKSRHFVPKKKTYKWHRNHTQDSQSKYFFLPDSTSDTEYNQRRAEEGGYLHTSRRLSENSKISVF